MSAVSMCVEDPAGIRRGCQSLLRSLSACGICNGMELPETWSQARFGTLQLCCSMQRNGGDETTDCGVDGVLRHWDSFFFY